MQYDDSGVPIHPEQKHKRSALFWVLMGCGGLLLLGMLFTAVAGFFLFQAGKELAGELVDPVAREQKAKEILGFSELPEGYSVSLALTMAGSQQVLLTDSEVDEMGLPAGGGLRMFQYTRLARVVRHAELETWFRTGEGDATALQVNGIPWEEGELLGRGEMAAGDARALWLAQRFDTDDTQRLSATVWLRCSGDPQMRLATWSVEQVVEDAGSAGGATDEPDEPEAEGSSAPKAEADVDAFRGTPADPDALADFLNRFRYCE